jgi:hypothetical protein
MSVRSSNQAPALPQCTARGVTRAPTGRLGWLVTTGDVAPGLGAGAGRDRRGAPGARVTKRSCQAPAVLRQTWHGQSHHRRAMTWGVQGVHPRPLRRLGNQLCHVGWHLPVGSSLPANSLGVLVAPI